MRRKDREITDLAEIEKMIARSEVCRIAMTDGHMPYVVPLNFGYAEKDGMFTIYFHCAREGKKLEILAKNPAVCFEIDGAHALIAGEEACDYGYRFESVIGFGKAKVLKTNEEKVFGLRKIMKQYTGKTDDTFSENALAAVCVVKVQLDELTGKRR